MTVTDGALVAKVTRPSRQYKIILVDNMIEHDFLRESNVFSFSEGEKINKWRS